MGVAQVLPIALLVLAIVLSMLGAAIAIRRVIRNASDVKRQEREQRLRPLLMRALAEDEPDFSPLNELNGKDADHIESLVWTMLSKVRGSAREQLVVWL